MNTTATNRAGDFEFSIVKFQLIGTVMLQIGQEALKTGAVFASTKLF